MKQAILNGKALNIPKEIMDQTTECPNAFSCLSCGQCGDSDTCKVEAAHSENILFIERKQHQSCPYGLSVGEDQICRCPVHYAIYKKYGHLCNC
jgi:hypothetical protein